MSTKNTFAKHFIFYIIIIIVVVMMIIFDKYYDAHHQYSIYQRYSFFPPEEQRYIVVDAATQHVGGRDYDCYVLADRYTGVMYLQMINFLYRYSTMVQLSNDDGSPMIYDNEGERE